MNTVRTNRTRFRVGDWVTFQYGTWQAFAQIIEDRGPLGKDRRRLYRIRLDQDQDEPIAFEMSEDDMELAVPDKAAILQYLKHDGLMDLLQTNLRDREKPPRVWLTFTRDGGLTHTLNRGLKVAGKGTAAPFFALLKNKVYTPDKAKVVEYLKTSFGLTQDEAEDVVQAVGTAP